jgi:hypothetical protein
MKLRGNCRVRDRRLLNFPEVILSLINVGNGTISGKSWYVLPVSGDDFGELELARIQRIEDRRIRPNLLRKRGIVSENAAIFIPH